jgi:gluconolactonase
MVLDLAGKTPSSPVSGMPPAGYDGSFNLEGPVWIGDALYASEISSAMQPNPGRIIRYVPGSTPTIFLAASGTNRLAVNAEGDLVIARQTDGTVSVLDIDNPNGGADVLTGMYAGERYNSPNDIAISSMGHIYFTDPDWQAPSPAPQDEERAYHLPPGGMATAIAGTPSKPNGITLSLDEQTLYITGTNGLQAYPVMPDGAVGAGSPVAGVSSGGDGMGMDCAGNLYVTTGTKVVVVGSSGSLVGEVEVGASVTNIAFGGADRKTMFITSLNPAALRTMDMDIPGLPY